jgi:hypothetical protein
MHVKISTEMQVTDRRLAQAVAVLRAEALVRGRRTVEMEDLHVLEQCYVIPGISATEQAFAKALHSWQVRMQERQHEGYMVIIGARLTGLRALAIQAKTYAEIQPVAEEAAAASAAARHYAPGTSVGRAALAEVQSMADAILTRADSLYKESKR